MDNREARQKLAAVHRAFEYYGLNEGIDNSASCIAKSLFSWMEKEIILMYPYGKLWSEAVPEDFIEVDVESGAMVTAKGLEKIDYTIGPVIGKPERTSLRENSLIYKLCPRKSFNTQRWAPKYYVALGAVQYWTTGI